MHFKQFHCISVQRLNEEQDEPSSPTLASVPLIHNIPELKVSPEVCMQT